MALGKRTGRVNALGHTIRQNPHGREDRKAPLEDLGFYYQLHGPWVSSPLEKSPNHEGGPIGLLGRPNQMGT
jgi:hypothetical protein